MANINNNDNKTQTLKIAVFTFFLNAGETTRAVEIAKKLRQLASASNQKIDIRFFSTVWSDDLKISYDHFITDAGFKDVVRIGDGLTREQWREMLDREHAGLEYFQLKDVPEQVHNVKETMKALREYDPSIVLHGFLDGAIASKIMNIPSITFLPLPLDDDFFLNHMLTDIPLEDQKYGRLIPAWLRRKLYHTVLTSPFLPTFGSQPTLRKIAKEAGWKVSGKGMLSDMCCADTILVNDLVGNYKGVSLDESKMKVTGPVFPHNNNNSGDSASPLKLDPEIVRVFDPKNTNKVFISMGSSGHRKNLLEALKAVGLSGEYNVVAVVPPSICSLEDLKVELVGVGGGGELPPSTYLTDKFIPAKDVNRLADVAVIHGGQGTVQTSMGSATPVVCVGFQPEQIWNLDCIERRGAGIQLAPAEWTSDNVGKSICDIFGDYESYKKSAAAVKNEMDASDGSAESARLVLEFAAAKASSS